MINKDLLSAYCDGEASPEDMARVEVALEADPALVAELEAMIEARARIAGAYDGFLEEPAPQRTVDLVRQSLGAHASNVVTFPGRKGAGPALRGQLLWPAAVAAALVAGVIGGAQLAGPVGGPTISLARGGAVGGSLAQALDGAVSGSPSVIEGGVLRVSLSFAARDGKPCRQFTLTAGQDVTSGLACRDAEAWTLRATTFESGVAGSDFRTAAGEGEDLVSKMADGLIAGEPFDQAEEGRRIRNGWR